MRRRRCVAWARAQEPAAEPPRSRAPNFDLRFDLLKAFDDLGRAVVAAPSVVAPLHNALESWAHAGLKAVGVPLPRMAPLPETQEPTTPSATQAAQLPEDATLTPLRCAAEAAECPAEDALSPAWWAHRTPDEPSLTSAVQVVQAGVVAAEAPAATALPPPPPPPPPPPKAHAAAGGCCVVQ